ncbi:ERI1 exoribonuclease 2 [Takifugu flavidus]|uniref:ERI1 exoribonuclease 2 n=1 Tax=Takifugu flavidus TaxID=433684 RepID=UPI0025442A6D|nr:ERI1 exoribonuclease 2 [Takifugu flavidus]
MSTKKLAKELGLLRKRSHSSSGLKKIMVSNQIFSHLIVIDFESTCWREKNNYSQEIIEFPAVLLNTCTGEVESEFHTYVQPQEHPTLSEFCTELTGITQMQVEAGIPLQICMSRFSRWLQNLQMNMGLVFPNNPQMASAAAASRNLCTFLTWSDWDLGVCLQYECRRKQIHKPDVLNSWIDLRGTYRLFYDRKPKGLKGALQDLGIQFAGREHSGLDDARNTAQLAARMMRDGCVMKVTRSLTRAPSVVKHICGNTAGDDKEENPKPRKREEALNTDKLSFSRDLDLKTNCAHGLNSTCQTLVSPKTLLCGTSVMPGGSSVMVRNGPAPHKNNSLVLCSTTVSCLSSPDHLNQPSEKREAPRVVGEEENADVFALETEERCGSYDDVLLENSDDINSGESDFDAKGYLWEESDNTASSASLLDIMRETVSKNKLKHQRMTSKSALMSLATKSFTSQVNRCNNVNKIRQQSKFKQPVAPKSVTQASNLNQLKTGLKIFTKVQEKSQLPHRNSKTNTLLSEKTSSPNPLFATPKVTVSHFNQTPKSSFSIYADPVKPSRDSFCATKGVLTSVSANILCARSNCSLTGGQRVTSPLCSCGRRAKRQLVSNGGPNHGRGFFCCPVRRSGGVGKVQKGCEFFKWESAVMRSNSLPSAAAGSSASLCQVNSSLSHPRQRSSRKSC